MPSGANPSALPHGSRRPPLKTSVALPPSSRISTRIRRRTAAAAGAAQPAVDCGFGHDRFSRSSSYRGDPPPRVPRPRPQLAVTPGPSRAKMPVPTVPVASDSTHHARRRPSGAFESPAYKSPDPFGASIRPYGRLRRPWRCSRNAFLPLRVFLTPLGKGSNRKSLRVTLSPNTLFSGGRLPCPPKSYRVFHHASAPPSRRVRRSLAKAASILS